MSQKVWIGEDDAEFWDDLNKLPGALLADITNKAVFCTDKAGGKRDLCFRIEESDTIRQDEDYHVLILDKGGKK